MGRRTAAAGPARGRGGTPARDPHPTRYTIRPPVLSRERAGGTENRPFTLLPLPAAHYFPARKAYRNLSLRT